MRSATWRAAAIHPLGGYQAGLVVRSILFRFGGCPRPEILPWVTYTDPELAHVGLTEAEARARHQMSRSCDGRWPKTTVPRPSAKRAGWSKC
jgi:pyruvate/2-oxoglutarate dehydrogenase complex dihydrolipoamide dehydrogenase (E3) component